MNSSADAPVLVKDIAHRQGISQKYLENLLVSLKNAGLLRSLRGAKGGYVLLKPPDKIAIEEIAVALEGPPDLIDCVSDPSICPMSNSCATNQFWRDMAEVLRDFMKKRTVKDLIENYQDRRNKESLMYYL